MSNAQVGLPGRGNRADYVLGTSEGWDAFDVVRWHAIEEISQPFRYEITLMRDIGRGAVDLDALLDAGASFRISSESRWRVVHGILAEAEEIDRTATIILYRVLLVPTFWRARYRRRCRTFVGKTLKEIVTSVLENQSTKNPVGSYGLTRLHGDPIAPPAIPSFDAFQPPTGTYRWNVLDEQRITDATNTPHIAQYNESDFAFVSRLLEQEGLSYYFVHDQSGEVLTITEAPGQAPLFSSDETFTMRRLNRGALVEKQEVIRALRDPRRLNSRAVTMRVYDYNRSLGKLEGSSADDAGDPEKNGHYEYPAAEELVQDTPGLHTAKVRMQRHMVERSLREGTSTLRTLEPGHLFTVHDADGASPDQKLLAVRSETFATEAAPQGTMLDEEPFGFSQNTGSPTPGYDNRFQALSDQVPFSPATSTQKPTINGVQTAFVTAEETGSSDEDRPKINADKLSRVRIRFPWDQREDLANGTPSSDWVRVSHYWAGQGYGALHIPRVGHEVIVAFLQGDPDRPIIVGRVYNAQNTPPYDPSQEPTKSTIKSQSAQEKKEVDGFNEIRFEDKAKQEEIYLHAQRNLNETVLASHSTSVGGDQSNSVGHDQTNTVQGDRTHTIYGSETVMVGNCRTTNIIVNEHHTVTGFRNTEVGVNDDHHVVGWHNVQVGVGSTLNVGGKRDVFIGADYNVKTKGSYVSEAGAAHEFKSVVTTFDESAMFVVKVGGCVLSMSPGMIVLNNGAGASMALIGGLAVVSAGSVVMVKSGGPMLLTAGGDISGKAPVIHWNG